MMLTKIQKNASGEILKNELCNNCELADSSIIDHCLHDKSKRRVLSVKGKLFTVTACCKSQDCIKSKNTMSKSVKAIVEGTIILTKIEDDYRLRLSNLAHNLDKYAGSTIQSVDSLLNNAANSNLSIYDQVNEELRTSPDNWTQFVINMYKTANSISIEIGAFRKLYNLELVNLDKHKIHSSTMNVVSPYTSSLRDKSLMITVKSCHEYVEIDYQIYHAGLFSLLENCRKYCKPESTIYVDFVEENNALFVTLKMISTKISKAECDLIFDPHYRTKNVSKKGLEGTGIGLSMARQLLRKINSDMSVTVEDYLSSTEYSRNTFVIGPFKRMTP